jgi:dienelactone hydrolase
VKLYFDDPSFDYQLQRTAAKVAYGCADLGEAFAIAARIRPGDYDSWYREWYAAGEANQQLAEAEAASGHRTNAALAYLRASEYYRSAYFFCRRDISAPVLLDAWGRSREMFRAATPMLPYPVEPVQIPYEGIVLEGYIQRPLAGGRGPTVLIPAGYDSPVEEFYSLGGCEAAARGFTVVTFSGPGQAEMLYERKLPFRPDFEAVVGPVIDFVAGRADLDAERLAIVGRSFGGYLAPRAASKEARIRALAADPAQTDMGAIFHAQFPPAMLELFDKGDPAFNDAIWKAFPGVAGQEYWLSRASAHGVSTPLAYAQEMQKYVVDVDAITCPTFVSYGEGDFAEMTTKAFYDRLKMPDKRFLMYKEADGGGGHCEGMGPSRYFTDVFGWLQDRWPCGHC